MDYQYAYPSGNKRVVEPQNRKQHAIGGNWAKRTESSSIAWICSAVALRLEKLDLDDDGAMHRKECKGRLWLVRYS